jgi:NDP-sugar pyrophosphorylase family protein
MKAMILAAGLGTRLKPFTDRHPKAMAIVNGKTLLQRNIEYLAAFNIKDVIVNVHHFPEQIIDIIKNNNGFGSEITISDEKDEVLETGGGLKKAGWYFKNDHPFVLMNVDVLTDMNLHKMIEQHSNSNAIATLAVSHRNTSRYFLFNDMEILCGWKNIKTGEQKIKREADKYYQKAFSGIHIISPDIFPFINSGQKISMVDVYLDLAKTHDITAFEHTDAKFIDVGKPESIKQAEKLFD